jgi:hypothetical protein
MRYELTGVRDNLSDMFGGTQGGLFEVCHLCFKPLAAMPVRGEDPGDVAEAAGVPVFQVDRDGGSLLINGNRVEERAFVEELSELHIQHSAAAHGNPRRVYVQRYPRIACFSGELWFSRWHRELPTGFAAIDLDVWSSCSNCGRLHLFEMVRGGADTCMKKPTTFVRKLAAMAGADAHVVAYSGTGVFIRNLQTGEMLARRAFDVSSGVCSCRG